MELNARIDSGPLAEKWDNHKFSAKLVNPANRRKFKVIVVGTGLAGASASATLAEQGYKVDTFCIHDSPRRAHSIAAQGGINAAKNYQNDNEEETVVINDQVLERAYHDVIADIEESIIGITYELKTIKIYGQNDELIDSRVLSPEELTDEGFNSLIYQSALIAEYNNSYIYRLK